MARAPLLVVAVVACALAWATLVQPTGCTQTAHYALVRSLADGTARIDPYQQETCDKAYTDGHFYSIKAPGLAFLALPPYAALDALGLVPESHRTAIWVLGLWTVVLPAALLLVLVARAGDRLAGGGGVAAAVTLGAATLLLPFATLVFSHVLTALLAFAAFVLLLHERAGSQRLWLVAGAGALAGLSVVAEYPTAAVAVLLAAYAAARSGVARRLAAYGAGLVAGLLPLVAYNVWAFGSATHLSYRNAVVVSGNTGHDVVGAHSEGFFGITWPSLRVVADLLVSAKGLATLTPVALAGAVGLVLLWRRGHRAEALVAAGVSAGFLVYNAGLTTTFGGPLGGDSPGPRYLVAVLPFLALGVAAAYRAAPLATGALALASLLTMAAATATEPMLGNFETSRWASLAADGVFTSSVVTLLGGGSGWLAVAPFLLLLALAAVAAALTLPARVGPRPLLALGAALTAWAVVSLAGPPLAERDSVPSAAAGLLLLGLAAAAAAAAAYPRVSAWNDRSETAESSKPSRLSTR